MTRQRITEGYKFNFRSCKLVTSFFRLPVCVCVCVYVCVCACVRVFDLIDDTTSKAHSVLFSVNKNV